MKIRDGFVSNSSSSSFILSANKTTKNFKTKIIVDIKDYITTTIKTENDIIKYFNEYYYGKIENYNELDNYSKKIYNKIKKELNNNKIVLTGTFSSDGDSIEQFLYNNPLSFINKNIKVIQEDGE